METGGMQLKVSETEPGDTIHAPPEDGLVKRYNIGYTPDRTNSASPGYHKIEVAGKKKDLVVQARDGYYGEK